MTAYGATVLAQSPVVFIRGDDPDPNSASRYQDTSGNARPMNVVGAACTISDLPVQIAGPKKSALNWPTANGGPILRTTYTTNTYPTVGTYEFWVKYAAAPAAQVYLLCWAPTSGSTGPVNQVYMSTDGKIHFNVYNGAGNDIVTPSALTTNVWHHVIASVGAAGMKIRLDKSTVATNVGVTAGSNLGASIALWTHGVYNGANIVGTAAALSMAEMAWYGSQLSDANTDSHYDADPEPAPLLGKWGMAA